LFHGLGHILDQNCNLKCNELLLHATSVRTSDDENICSSNEVLSMKYIQQRMYGCRIAKYFGNVIYVGYVIDIDSNIDNADVIDETSNATKPTRQELRSYLYTIQYDDADVEDMNIYEVFGM
jgi:hypothetical protein